MFELEAQDPGRSGVGDEAATVKSATGIGWRDVFDLAPSAMSIIDPHGRQLAGNRAYAELLGYPVEEVDRIDVGAITRPEDREWSAGYLARLATGDLDEFVTVKRYVRRNGGEVTARLHTRALRDDDGRCVALLGTLTPIEATTGVDDARLRRFLAHAQSTFTVVDSGGRVLETSGRYQAILGYPTEFWEHRTVFDLLTPESMEAAAEFRQELLDHPAELRSIELDVRASDGSVQLVLVHAINLLADPEVNGVVISSQNVTEQRRVMDELAARRDTAEAVAEARTNLLATVSHELRNPLHAVQGLAELLAAEHLPPRAAGLAATLTQQLNGLARVTEDLLETARFDAGAVELHPTPVDVRNLVAEVVGYGVALAGERPVSVVADVAAGSPAWLLADGHRLRQVLRNLVGNAVKFTDQGPVSVALVPMAAGVAFTVADTGVGIPADELEAVMEPFRTGSSAGEGRGAGLGLALVQRLVAAMGGDVRIASQLGRGTQVRVELPLTAVPAPDAPAAGSSNEATTLTVLVVEDNPVNQQLARSQLEHLSMIPLIVDSGEAALALLGGVDRPPVDVILMDQQLPGLSGTQTAQQLRMLGPPVAKIPIIGLTASASAADRAAFLDAGLDGFVAKPARLDDIRSAIEEVLLAAGPAEGESSVPAPGGAFAGAVPGVPDGLDAGALDRLAAEFGDPAIVRTLVQTFLTELPARREALIGALIAADTDTAGRAAHTLKSSARLLGAAALGEECERIERRDNVEVAPLGALLDRTRRAMETWLREEH